MSNAVGMPLAQYKQRRDYVAKYGDYVIWSGWFSTWHGFVIDYDKLTDEVSIIFAGVPFLLLTMEESDHAQETKKLKLADIRNEVNGKYAIQTTENNTSIWYI